MKNTEKIGSFYMSSEDTDGPTFIYTFKNIANANSRLAAKLGLFFLKVDTTYKVKIEITNESGVSVASDPLVELDTGKLNVNSNNTIDGLFSSIFDLSTPMVPLTNKSVYTATVTLMDENERELDRSTTYFFALQE